jgi:DNA-binding SARP family transcriptional activator
MKIRLLGPLQVHTDLGSEEVASRKVRSLLAIMALSAGRTVAPELLINELWSCDSIKNAKNAFHATVARLRKVLEYGHSGPLILSRPSGYVLDLAPSDVDATVFVSSIKDALKMSASDPRAAVDILDEALELWRSDPLADVEDTSLLRAERVRLVETYFVLLETRAEALLALGEFQGVAAELRHLTGLHPDRERLQEFLMLALYAGGQQTDALRVYREVSGRLRDEYGVDPGAGLRKVHSGILSHTVPPGLVGVVAR